MAVKDGKGEVKRRENAPGSSYLLENAENALRQHSPADFKTAPDAEEETLVNVFFLEAREHWRAGYDSLESFYAAHEERHPDIRSYAARARSKRLHELEEVLRANRRLDDFVTKPNAAKDCILAVNELVDHEHWRAGYDSLESFYAAHEEQHPDIRVYDAASEKLDTEILLAEPSVEQGRAIAERIAETYPHRWRDAWFPPVLELITGCILLVLSAGFWSSADAGPIWSLKHWPWTVGAILGPWFVYRAWKRKM